MYIQAATIKNLRNLASQELSFSPSFNVMIGHNGAGKTSLLEALYLMGTGRSFRTRQLDQLIQIGTHGVSVALQLVKHESNEAAATSPTTIPVRIVKQQRQPSQLYMGENPIQSVAEITQLLPLQLITQESYRLLDDGPEMRRKFLDQGLFYSDPEFFPLWKRSMHALKQRNAALKMHQTSMELDVWDMELSHIAAQLSARRQNFLEKFEPVWLSVLQDFLTAQDIQMAFKQGWSTEHELLVGLRQQREQDKLRGFTSLGPHRADLMFLCQGKSAREVLSRGQKKLLIYSLCLAQATLMLQQHQIKFVYLIDELPAELDAVHRKRVIECLIARDAQIFMTGTELSEDMLGVIKSVPTKMFHVEHGVVNEVA